MTESKELVVAGNKGLTLASLGDMYKFAQYAIASQKGTQDGGWIPQCYKTPEQVVMAVQCGAEIGLSPMQALQVIYPVRGRAGIMGEGAMALVLASGRVKEFTVQWEWGRKGEKPTVSDDIPADMTPPMMQEKNLTCVITAERADFKGKRTFKFSVQDAVNAKLWSSGVAWEKMPKDMLYYRTLSRCLHQQFPDIIKGVAIKEADADIDFNEPKNIESAPAPAPAVEMDPFDGTPMDTSKPISVAPIAPAPVAETPKEQEPPIMEGETVDDLPFGDDEEPQEITPLETQIVQIAEKISKQLMGGSMGVEKVVESMCKRSGVADAKTKWRQEKVLAFMLDYAAKKGVK